MSRVACSRACLAWVRAACLGCQLLGTEPLGAGIPTAGMHACPAQARTGVGLGALYLSHRFCWRPAF